MKNLTPVEKFTLGVIVLIGAALLFSGCSYQPAINAAEKAALQSAEAANDNILDVSVTALCSMPYRTFLRHPETWPWLNQMCAPGIKEKTPNDLLAVPAK